MKRVAEILFSIWILSFPFYHYSIVGTLAVDNMLAPALLVLWMITKLLEPEAKVTSRSQGVSPIVVVLIGAYFLAHTATLLNTQNLVWLSMYSVAKDLLYFVIPLLYLDSKKMQERVADFIIIIALIGALSAFLAAIGVLHLNVARFSQSRVEIEGLTRTVGLFGVYGDMAILSSFAILVALNRSRKRLLFVKRRKSVVVLVLACVLLGLLGSQSRNMVLTISVSLFVFLLVGHWLRQGGNWPRKFYGLLYGGGLSVLLLVVILWQPLFEMLSSWGGQQAAGTAYARLSQYQVAWELLKDNPLLGASSKMQITYGHEIGYIHNMWLKELVQAGVFGVLSLLGLLLYGLKSAVDCLLWNPLDHLARVKLAIIVAVLVSTQFNPSGTAVFWMILGVVLSGGCAGRKKIATTGGVSESAPLSVPGHDRILVPRRK